MAGGKGKSILIHSLTEAQGMPLANRITPANEDERAQVLPLLDAVKLRTGKRGRPRKRLKVIATDKGYDAKALRHQLRKRPKFFARLHLETQVGCSPSALRRVMHALEAAMLETAEAWGQDGGAGGAVRESIGAVDETFLARMMLVFMDQRCKGVSYYVG